MLTMPGPCGVSFRSVIVPWPALSRVRLDAAYGGNTLAGRTLGSGSIVEHRRTHPASEANLVDGLEHCREIDRSKALPLKVYGIGVEEVEMPSAGHHPVIDAGAAQAAKTGQPCQGKMGVRGA